jgi:uncharacterized protein with PIN domain
MVLDSSAIIAIFLNEPDAAVLERKTADDPVRMISAGMLIETAMLIESKLAPRADASWTFGCNAKVEMIAVRSKPSSPDGAGAASAKVATLPASATALPTHSQSRATNRSCSRAATFRKPTLGPLDQRSAADG